MTARPYPPPPPSNVRPTLRARIRRPARRWARRIDGAVLFITPLLLMFALLLAAALPYVAAAHQTGRVPDSCSLVGTTWSCTSSAAAH